jgi:hypothetical protein
MGGCASKPDAQEDKQLSERTKPAAQKQPSSSAPQKNALAVVAQAPKADEDGNQKRIDLPGSADSGVQAAATAASSSAERTSDAQNGQPIVVADNLRSPNLASRTQDNVTANNAQLAASASVASGHSSDPAKEGAEGLTAVAAANGVAANDIVQAAPTPAPAMAQAGTEEPEHELKGSDGSQVKQRPSQEQEGNVAHAQHATEADRPSKPDSALRSASEPGQPDSPSEPAVAMAEPPHSPGPAGEAPAAAVGAADGVPGSAVSAAAAGPMLLPPSAQSINSALGSLATQQSQWDRARQMFSLMPCEDLLSDLHDLRYVGGAHGCLACHTCHHATQACSEYWKSGCMSALDAATSLPVIPFPAVIPNAHHHTVTSPLPSTFLHMPPQLVRMGKYSG